LEEIKKKLEYYCSYQERCHLEVAEKLRAFGLIEVERDAIMVHLIENNFLNEERFSSIFSMSKFHQKKWGKIRIKNELKARKISDYLISKALKEIPINEYQSTFEDLAEKYWNTISEKNDLKKQKKCCDFLIRKGWETDLIYDKIKELKKISHL